MSHFGFPEQTSALMPTGKARNSLEEKKSINFKLKSIQKAVFVIEKIK